MRLKLIVLTLLSAALFSSCDPGLSGDLKVYNNATIPISIIAFDYGSKDSSKFTVQPNGNETIKVLGGLGNKKTFDCCPCEFEGIIIKTTNGNIKKDPANKDNWLIPNKNKLKKYGKEGVQCEFYVNQSDI